MPRSLQAVLILVRVLVVDTLVDAARLLRALVLSLYVRTGGVHV
ncbi:hypothetical protein RI138_17590 [Streptomyces sp. C11-1]|uniref:Uncharacterized protein n=1 Tax=Streptomyces durocortorensis TaxID=2811104 RepID=A0ABY9VY84_9ACTN|nr:hypothetical protein [Streptomyces durocortorensis]WNF28500.1 hypothetical protein RI138_17590 [Streptomyces durocortorensis]